MKFLSDTLWPEIKRVARDGGPRYVAVPFLPSGAFSRLPLKKGDVLVVRFDDATIKGGQTDPREVLKYLRAGVEVHNNSVLHAKVYVSSRRAVVCSANLSAVSERTLSEAGIVSTASAVLRQSKRFVSSMRGDIVEPGLARSKISIYSPPVLGGHRSGRKPRRTRMPRIEQSPIWVLVTEYVDYDEADEAAEERAMTQAQKRLKDPDRFRTESISWERPLPVRVGDRIIRIDVSGRAKEIEAPMRAIAVVDYEGPRGGRRTMISVEIRKYLRPKRLTDVRRRLGPRASVFGKVFQSRKLRDAELLYRLGQLWPTA